MEPSETDELDEALRAALPRAPRGFADAVERRVGARRRGRGWVLGASVLTAMAAALVLWLLARPSGPPAPASPWLVAEAKGVTLLRPDGAPAPAPRPGQLLAIGAELRVGDGGDAALVRPAAGDGGAARARLSPGAAVRVGARELTLAAGAARLDGDGARLDGEAAQVILLGDGAEAMIEMRRQEMTRGKMLTKWAGPALMAVSVLSGSALVEARTHAPVQLMRNDRMVVASGLPPLVTRAAAAPAKTATSAPQPAVKPASKPAATTSEPPMKEQIRSSVRAVRGELAGCYEKVLGKESKVAGRMVVQMRIVARDGKGRVDDAEVLPQENGGGDLASPLFEQCVLEVLAKADFPRPTGDEPLIVTYPFVFSNETNGR
jgi:hypothetical protein